MSASMNSVVDLGFVEKTDQWRLLSHFFPSKVGGKPAWLSLKNIPGVDRINCGECGTQCVFLLQVYANLDEKEDCFHRTIFLFICKSPKCVKIAPEKALCVFRSQLPQVNQFYSDTAMDDSEHPNNFTPVDKFHKLCFLCGCSASKSCSKCHVINYCSKEHQTIDWKQSHKKNCGTQSSSSGHDAQTMNIFIFPEYDLVTEPEDFKEKQQPDKSEKEKIKEYEDFLKSDSAKGLLKGIKEEDFTEMAKNESKEDKMFKKFVQRIQIEPQQVLRYDRGGEPVWVSSEQKPVNIPACFCGSPREFEFQVMPQLLSYLAVDSLEDSIDWGTLVVYTCKNSCDIGEEYIKEYMWKQEFSNINNAT